MGFAVEVSLGSDFVSCPRNQYGKKAASCCMRGGWGFPSLGFHRGVPGEEYNIYGDSDTELPSFMEVGIPEVYERFSFGENMAGDT